MQNLAIMGQVERNCMENAKNCKNGTGGKKLDRNCENWQKSDRWKKIVQKM